MNNEQPPPKSHTHNYLCCLFYWWTYFKGEIIRSSLLLDKYDGRMNND